jgi:hypothetical protein
VGAIIIIRGKIMTKSFILLLALFSMNLDLSAESIKPPVTTVFCHGVVDNNSQINHYIDQSIFGKTFSFDFPDATPDNSISLTGVISKISGLSGKTEQKPCGKQVNRDQMFMGQTKDIECLENNLEQFKNKPVILYGASRGAATIISYLGKKTDTSNVKAIVLEAPPADILDGVDNFSAKLGLSLPHALLRTIFYRYPENPYTPIDAIKDIQNKDLPVFITHSAEDTTVNPSQPWKLYKKFKECGFKNVYINETETGRHCHLHLKEDFHKRYCVQIQSFYEKFDLFNNESTIKGKEFYFLSNIESYSLQPSIEYADAKIKEYTDQRNALYQFNKKRNASLITALAIAAACYLYFSKK